MNAIGGTMNNAALAPADRRSIAVITGLIVLGALATVIGFAVTLWQILTQPSLEIYGALTNEPASFDAASGGTVEATVATLDLVVTDPPAGLRAVAAGAAATGALVPLSTCAALVFLGLTVLRENFRRRAAIALAVLSVVAFAGACFSPLLYGIAAHQGLSIGPMGDIAPFGFAITADALVAPTLLLVVAAVLLVGARLQRETEGLV